MFNALNISKTAKAMPDLLSVMCDVMIFLELFLSMPK